ncbi:F0F1 ATP synthase subunit A [Fontivita pretiosa]|jgi:F0F1-type ATP synthase membrane subunit a|uniref:F0F1 ATP synthase subunit A n=1 Tax=Fontivita pretiosa TaxID=2989684 RepID=UPI003D175234
MPTLNALLAAADPLDHVLPHDVHLHIGPFQLTNHMLMALVAAVLMLAIFPPLFRRPFEDAPHGARNFFESILEFLRVEVFRPALKEHTDRFVPFLWTLFFFILFCNLLGQIPIAEIITIITGRPSHLGGTATGNLTTTGALAIVAFLFIHVNGIWQVAWALMSGTYGHHPHEEHHEEHSASGQPPHEAAHDLEHVRGEALPADVPADIRAISRPTGHYEDDEFAGPHTRNGIRQGDVHHDHPHGKGLNPVAALLLAVPLYFWNFAPHPFKPGPGQSKLAWAIDVPMWLVLLALELIGAVIKPFALMIRLFANMIAGHIVLAALVLLIPVTAGVIAQIGIGVPVTALSLLIRLLELFVAFLQAYIFTFLTTLFIASAVAPEH